MYLKSLYPEIPPCPPALNVYLALAGRPDQDAWPDYTAHIEHTSGRTWSFRQLLKRINDVATALGAPISSGGLGLGPGTEEIVGIISDNSSVSGQRFRQSNGMAQWLLQDYVTLTLALLKIAVPYVLISCYSTPFELRHALSLSKATRLFVAPQYLGRVLPTALELGMSKDNMYLMNEDVKGQKTIESFIRGVETGEIPEEKARIVTKDTIAYMVFSSGTSGLPKGWSESLANHTPPIDDGKPSWSLMGMSFAPLGKVSHSWKREPKSAR